MRKIALNWALAFALVAGVSGVGTGSSSAVRAATPGDDGVVHLDGPAALAELRATNPTHYALARKIMAEANHLCRPTAAAQIQRAKPEGKLDSQDRSCGAALLETSNPPKRKITFILDHTVYVATVTVTDDPPRLVSASSRR